MSEHGGLESDHVTAAAPANSTTDADQQLQSFIALFHLNSLLVTHLCGSIGLNCGRTYMTLSLSILMLLWRLLYSLITVLLLLKALLDHCTAVNTKKDRAQPRLSQQLFGLRREIYGSKRLRERRVYRRSLDLTWRDSRVRIPIGILAFRSAHSIGSPTL
ncbi:hypothetical protein V3C99_013643 [Haemonchus contortus]